MARAAYAVTPRALFDDERFLGLPESASSLLLRIYGTCDRWGRFPATPIALARRVGLLRIDIDADIAAIAAAGLVRLYDADGAKCGEVTGLETVLTARMIVKRGAPDFPDPPWHQGAPNGSGHGGNGTARGHLGAPCGDLGVHLSGPPDSQEPEPEPKPEPERHTPPAGAPEHTHVATAVPANSGPRSGAPDLSALETPDLDPASEALVGQLVEAIVAARFARPRGNTGGLTIDQVRFEFAKTSQQPSQLRALAVSNPEAWRAMARKFLDQYRDKIGSGADGTNGNPPGWLRYLTTMVEGWAPGSDAPPVRESRRAIAARTPRVLGPPPTTKREPDMSREELEQMHREFPEMFPPPKESANA